MSERPVSPAVSPDGVPAARRGPFPWLELLAVSSEVLGLVLIAIVLYMAWSWLPLAELGLLLLYLPNRR